MMAATASSSLDFAAIKSALGEQTNRAQNALTLSDQIGPILASGAKGNPRQIKRFLNTLVLRQRTADARGFGDDIKLPVLAKLMLAERFLPRLFDQVASASAVHPNGYCNDLAMLEAPADERKSTGASPPKGDSKPRAANDEREPASRASDGLILAEWLSSQPIRDWAQINPLWPRSTCGLTCSSRRTGRTISARPPPLAISPRSSSGCSDRSRSEE